MSLYRPKGTRKWWVRFSVAGRKTRRTTGTEDRAAAEEFEQRERERQWRLHKLKDRSAIRWSDAANRWLNETAKRSKYKDELMLSWLEKHLKEEALSSIDTDAIIELRKLMLDEGFTKANIDRYMCLVRSILRKSASEWRYLDAAPKVPMFRPATPEPRWLRRDEFERLCSKMPKHMELAARFSVYTGLRMRSMLALTWDRIDLEGKRAWVPGAQMKAGRAHGMPLSSEAVRILEDLKALNPTGVHVFQWKGKPIDSCNTGTFKECVKAAGLEPLRWHDFRHTFASWAVQSGVSLHELMQLGGWKTYDMVLKYSHLAPDHLAQAAEKLVKKRA